MIKLTEFTQAATNVPPQRRDFYINPAHVRAVRQHMHFASQSVIEVVTANGSQFVHIDEAMESVARRLNYWHGVER